MVMSYFPLALTINISMSATAGPWFNIKMTSYQYRKSHCGDKTIVRSSYLHNGISYTDKMSSLYWTSPQDASLPGARSRLKKLAPSLWYECVCLLFSYILSCWWKRHSWYTEIMSFSLYHINIFLSFFRPYICVSYLYLYLYNGFCKPICITSDFLSHQE